MTSTKRIAAFVALACGISWLIWLPLLDRAPLHGWRWWIYYGGVAGPAIAALVMALAEGPEALAGLRARVTRWRVGWMIVAAAILLPLAVQGVSLLILRAIHGELAIAWRPVASLAPLALLVLLLVPFEEIGWRGDLLPRLDARMRWPAAGAVMALVWGGWHLPLAWVTGGFQESGSPVLYVTRFIVTLLPVSCVIAWLCERSGGSIAIPSLFHWSVDMTDRLLLLPQKTGVTLSWINAVVMMTVAVCVWRWAPVRASRSASR
jgi:membrane protease YdiL (CAAX protease family)